MVLSIRRSLSRHPYSALAPRPPFTRAYVRKRAFLVTHFPKLVALLLLLYFLIRHHRRQALRSPRRRPALRAPPPTPALNLSLSVGVRRPGVSLVAACQNHHEALRYTIPSWRRVRALDEIVLIDWSSTPPLRFLVDELDRFLHTDTPLSVIHVAGEYKWEPARAFNLGFRVAQFASILRVECDHKVRHDFIAAHKLETKAMYAGNSRLIRANEDEDLAGTLFIGKKDLLEVGGYDERLQDYGGEQKDLLERLDKNRMRRLNIDYSTLLHNHYDGEAERGLTSRQVENLVEEAVNLELREKVPMWNSLEAWRSFSFIPESMLEPNASVPSRIHANVQYRDIVGRSQVPSIRDVLMDSVVDTTKGKVLSRMLHEWFDMPSDFTDLLDGSDKDRILYALLEKRQTASRFTTPRVLVMHCVGGLIPRLFALASGLAIANHTDRLPIVVWEKEAPLVTALFQELFEVQEHFMVAGIYTKQFFEKYTEDQKSGEEMRSMQVYDLAGQQEASSKLIHTSSGTHIFIRASKAVGADVVRYTSPMSIREQFQMLALEESVQSRLRDLADKGISERLGIYVGQSEPNENSDITDLGTIMKEKVEAVRPGALPPAYIVSDLPTFERIRPVFGSIIHNLPLSMDCTAEDIDCSRTELVRLFALTKTREFISIQEAQEDDLSELVMLLRGHSTDW